MGGVEWGISVFYMYILEYIYIQNVYFRELNIFFRLFIQSSIVQIDFSTCMLV